MNHRSTLTYLKRIQNDESPTAEEEKLDDEQRAHELLIFGLRRLAGVSRQQFFQQAEIELDTLAGKEIERFVELGLLCDDGQTVKLTREGLLISDSMWPELL